MPQLSDWTLVPSSGVIPADLLPAALVQYRWVVHHEFPVPPGFGVGGGYYEMEWEVAISGSTPAYASVDYAKFFCVTLHDPLLGGRIAFYTYYPVELTTTGDDICETLGGVDPTWVDDWPPYGVGLDELYITGWWQSPVYYLDLASGATVTVSKHATQSGIPSPGWMLEMRTAPGGVDEMPVIRDHPSGDRHEFRIYRKVLLTRRWLSGFGMYDGPTSGLSLSAGTGLAVNVAAGEMLIGHMPATLPAATSVTVTASTTNYIWAVLNRNTWSGASPTLDTVATTGTDRPDGVAYLLGIVVAGASSVTGSNIDEAQQGTVVCFDCDAVGATDHESGVMECVVDRGSVTGEVWRSTDKGLSWTAV